MSLHRPSRRIVALATNLTRQNHLSPNPLLLPLALPSTTRSKWNLSRLNPFRKDPPKDPTTTELDDPLIRRRMMGEAATPKLGTSIFADEVAAAEEPAAKDKDGKGLAAAARTPIRPEDLEATRDPDPRSRLRWERKMVMRMVSRSGGASPESRSEIIRRTEREMRYRSPDLPTSVKKLVHLARQVTGKTVDDALVQMRYSKKKMGREVGHFLEIARDKAVVENGMGLGAVNGEAPLEKPRKIKDAEGSWLDITDPTRIYIAQAWVGKGPWRGQRLVHLGRGRKAVQKKPSTSITFVLKEERTRIRQYDEARAKEARHGPWVHLPNRPITAQRQYYTW